MMRNVLPLALACGVAAAGGGHAQAACKKRVVVQYGETLAQVAQRCDTNIEALKQANPGSHITPPGMGNFVTVPSPPLPTPRVGGGNRAVSPP